MNIDALPSYRILPALLRIKMRLRHGNPDGNASEGSEPEASPRLEGFSPCCSDWVFSSDASKAQRGVALDYPQKGFRLGLETIISNSTVH